MLPNLPRTVTRALGELHWLDAPARALQRAVHRVYEAAGTSGQHVKNFLHGVWLGHPLHPVLTDVPIGAWSTAVVLDALEAGTRRPAFGRGADVAIATGLVGASAAAVAGLTDWYQLSGKPRRVGMLHAVLNVTATGLYGASMWQRVRGQRRAGRQLGLGGFLAAMAGAYLGGHLVYALRIGVRHSRETSRPDNFVAVLPVAELGEGQLRRVDSQGQPILLVRRGDRIFAMLETCSHLGGPLSEGWLVEDSVVCPWHQSRYALETGKVLDGPSAYSQPCFETRVRNGQIEVRARPPEPQAERVLA
jgi:nitrite reductase/ring-hydroxylating ferredoxin subunit/uncharacterized membrane protein